MERRRNVALLLLIQASLLGWVGWAAAPNKTEGGHMAATVYLWQTLRFDVFRVNPPLTRIIGGLPVAMCRPKHDWRFYSSRPQNRSEWAIGKAFIAANTPEKTRWCFSLARWSLIPVLLTAGYFGHRLSWEMYGDWAAMLFLVLWCFSPFLLAWGATICPDAAATALGLVAVYTFRGWLCKPNWARACVAGACLGLLPLAKLTWVIAFGLWPLIWFMWTIPSRPSKAGVGSRPWPPLRQLAVILFLGLYVLNMGYLFDGTGRRLGEYSFLSHTLVGEESPGGQAARVARNRFVGTWLGAIPAPLPSEFVQGIDAQRYDFERTMPSYLRGQWADHGW
ncbi:MAG: hypothetical protein HQ582_11695, partial [Planctomycetes bacterium]|nr:hypothetical protein [Planctomycetota bacterium]